MTKNDWIDWARRSYDYECPEHEGDVSLETIVDILAAELVNKSEIIDGLQEAIRALLKK